MTSEAIEYEVHTANEDGWTDYHEEDDVTCEFDVALAWLGNSDVVWGEIKVDGKVIAWTEEIDYSDEEPQDEYDARYNPRPRNRLVFADGWDSHGKVE